MQVSVIIPSYKPKAYLWECLDSLCQQTLSKECYEVIIVLNGCRDPYETDIKEYIVNHPQMQFVYLQTDKKGVSNARNIALDIAKGRYVTFIDDDDYVSPSFLRDLLTKATDDTIVLSNSYAFEENDPGKQLQYGTNEAYDFYQKTGNRNISSKVRKYFSGVWIKLIPMNIIRNRRFDIRFRNGEDSLFMFLISDRIRYIEFTGIDAVYYRRVRNLSASTVNRDLKEIIKTNAVQICAYIAIYIKHPFDYNLSFFVSRVGGSVAYIASSSINRLFN